MSLTYNRLGSVSPIGLQQLACSGMSNPIIAKFDWTTILNFIDTPIIYLVPSLSPDVCEQASRSIITTIVVSGLLFVLK